MRPWVKHTHMHDLNVDPNGKIVFVPPFTGMVPQKEVMRLLKADGYKGYFSLEVMGQDPEPTLAAYAQKFRELLEQI